MTDDIQPDDWNEGLNHCALLSEAFLAVDWNRPEEDAAWQYLAMVEIPVSSRDTAR